MFSEVKNYALILLDFNHRKYHVYFYERNWRFTANQAWDYMINEKPSVTGSLNPSATIFTYYTLIDIFQLNEKYCDRYCSFEAV